jgi:hypothetical protein
MLSQALRKRGLTLVLGFAPAWTSKVGKPLLQSMLLLLVPYLCLLRPACGCDLSPATEYPERLRSGMDSENVSGPLR